MSEGSQPCPSPEWDEPSFYYDTAEAVPPWEVLPEPDGEPELAYEPPPLLKPADYSLPSWHEPSA